MKNLQRKLRSKTGSTMIMALMFLLFCSFVGSTVLVSATANAYRVAHLNEQQDFLNQRSAALLLSDQMQLETGEMFRMHIVKAEKSYQQYDFTDEKVATPIGEPVEQTVITFQLITNDHEVTALQRLMLETTVWRYLLENAAGQKCTVVVQDFWEKSGSEDGIAITDFWYKYKNQETNIVELSTAETGIIEGELDVSGSWVTESGTSVTLPGYIANFTSCKGEDLYDFVVDFGENSQFQMTMGAYSGTTDPIDVVGTIEEGYMPGSNTLVNVKVTTRQTTTTISWDDPVVEKGGAGE